MSRISYEGGTLMLIIEGLARNSHYYYEPNICTANTYHTISTLVQRDVNQCQLYRRMKRNVNLFPFQNG